MKPLILSKIIVLLLCVSYRTLCGEKIKILLVCKLMVHIIGTGF